MTDKLLFILLILIVAGAFIGWLANVFTVAIPVIAKNLYLMLVLCLIVYLAILLVRVA